MLCSSLTSCSDFTPVLPKFTDHPIILAACRRGSRSRSELPQVLWRGFLSCVNKSSSSPLAYLVFTESGQIMISPFSYNKQSARVNLITSCWCSIVESKPWVYVLAKTVLFSARRARWLARSSAFPADPRWLEAQLPLAAWAAGPGARSAQFSAGTAGRACTTFLLLLNGSRAGSLQHQVHWAGRAKRNPVPVLTTLRATTWHVSSQGSLLCLHEIHKALLPLCSMYIEQGLWEPSAVQKLKGGIYAFSTPGQVPSKSTCLHSDNTAFVSFLSLKGIYFFPGQWHIHVLNFPLGHSHIWHLFFLLLLSFGCSVSHGFNGYRGQVCETKQWRHRHKSEV